MNPSKTDFLSGLNYGYVGQMASNIRTSLGITQSSLPMEYGPLVSIHMQSNRPENFSQFLDNLQASVDDPTRIEVVVKIDDTDEAMNRLLPLEVAKRPFALKYISTPLVGGFVELWRSMNDMLKVCHPHAYFLWNMNDEMAVLNKGWDTMLLNYVGLFPDHIFRLRTSLFRFRNYYDYWECGFAPETSAITTKRWIDICGDWNPCLGPDSFNQCVSFYFGYHDRFNKHKALRDVPVHDIILGGEGAFIGLEGDKLWRRVRSTTRAWYTLMSHKTQNEASRRSQKLRAHIWAEENALTNVSIDDDRFRQYIVVRSIKGKALARFRYRLSPVRIWLTNLHRATHFYYYGGGGELSRAERFRQICAFLALRYDSFEWLYRAHRWQRKENSRLRPIIRRRLSRIFDYYQQQLQACTTILYKGLRAFFRFACEQARVIRHAGMMVLRALFKLASRMLRHKIQYHESVYAFDKVAEEIDWPAIGVLTSTITWPTSMDAQMRMILLKCLLLKHWYHLSDTELEAAVGRDLAFRRFTGIPLNAPLPSLAQLHKFQKILQNARIENAVYQKAPAVNDASFPIRPFIGKVA